MLPGIIKKLRIYLDTSRLYISRYSRLSDTSRYIKIPLSYIQVLLVWTEIYVNARRPKWTQTISLIQTRILLRGLGVLERVRSKLRALEDEGR